MSEANPKRGLGRGLNALFEDDEEFGGAEETSAPALDLVLILAGTTELQDQISF